MRPARVVIALGLFLALTGSGCLDAYNGFQDFDKDAPYRNAGVFEGGYRMGNSGSMPMFSGTLRAAARPDIIILESERPYYGAASQTMSTYGQIMSGEDESRVDIVMAIWHPDNYTAKTPIIVDAGPYYEIGEHCEIPGQIPCQRMVPDTIDYPGQSTPFLLQNMLPRGYTIAQIAVRGTGTAGGCMDLMGPDELADLDQALTWLGEQEWSNGRIGMMGVSYDGSTPWNAAATGNQYLKTIVPISGLPDIYDLMLHNGSAESRAALMHGPQVYWGYGFSDEFPQGTSFLDQFFGPMPPILPPAGVGQANGRKDYQDRQNLICPEAFEGQTVGLASANEGSRLTEATTYWSERDHRDEVLANYKGSVFLIHGLQDWNVDPHAAIPFNQKLRDAGLEVKEWYGQWGHQNADSNCQPGAPGWVVLPCRLDYGEVLVRWYDKHLMGYPSILNAGLGTLDANLTANITDALTGVVENGLDPTLEAMLDTGPAIQIQDNLGVWRNADSYPPHDANWLDLGLGSDEKLGSNAAGDVTLKAATPATETNTLRFVSEPFPEGLHISGLPQVKVPFSVTGQGGFLAAWLFDVDPNGLVRLPQVARQPIAPDSDILTWKPVGIPVVGHAQMNLRFYAGGEERQALQPGETYIAQIEFEPLEVHIPEGHSIMLWLFQYPYPEHSPSGTPSDVIVHLGADAKLLLPTLDLDPRTIFPVPGVSFPNSTENAQMYVRAPVLPGVSGSGGFARQDTPTAASTQSTPTRASSGADRAGISCVAQVGCAR